VQARQWHEDALHVTASCVSMLHDDLCSQPSWWQPMARKHAITRHALVLQSAALARSVLFVDWRTLTCSICSSVISSSGRSGSGKYLQQQQQ
jgi:hypothetical protein